MNNQSDGPIATYSGAQARPEKADPIRAYLDLAHRWDATTRELDGLASQLGRAAERLQGTAWRKARVGSFDFPADLPQYVTPPWPSAEDLGKRMADWHALKAELHRAWQLVPAEDRRQLKDPPL